MPSLLLTCNQPIDEFQQHKIASSLLHLTTKYLKKDPKITNIIISDTRSSYFSGGAQLKDFPLINLVIFITKGTNSAKEKSLWLSSVWSYLKQELLISTDNPNYIVIQEVSGDCWGYNGISQNQRKSTNKEIQDAV